MRLSSRVVENCALAAACRSFVARLGRGYAEKTTARAPRGGRRLHNASRRRMSAHGKDGATVLFPGIFVRPRNFGALLAIGNGVQTRLRNTLRHQHVPHGAGTTITQSQVILSSAALIRMAFDCELDILV